MFGIGHRFAQFAPAPIRVGEGSVQSLGAALEVGQRAREGFDRAGKVFLAMRRARLDKLKQADGAVGQIADLVPSPVKRSPALREGFRQARHGRRQSLFGFATLSRSFGGMASKRIDPLTGRFASFAERIQMIKVPRALLRKVAVEGGDPSGKRLQRLILESADLRTALRDLFMIGAIALVHQRVDGFGFRHQLAQFRLRILEG